MSFVKIIIHLVLTALNKKINNALWLNFFVKSLIEAVYITLIKFNFNDRKTKMKINQKHFIKLTFSQQHFLTFIPISTDLPALGRREKYCVLNRFSVEDFLGRTLHFIHTF